jgi:hypothetical protein
MFSTAQEGSARLPLDFIALSSAYCVPQLRACFGAKADAGFGADIQRDADAVGPLICFGPRSSCHDGCLAGTTRFTSVRSGLFRGGCG